MPSATATRFVLPLLAVLLLGCEPRGEGVACGITALAGATAILDQFNVPNQTLSVPPAATPEFLPVRVAAGPAYRSRVRLDEAGWLVTLEGSPAAPRPGFGVVVVGPDGRARGVLAFTGLPVQSAPMIGRLAMDTTLVPLLGLRTDVAGLEDAACPFFPDSLRGP